MHLSQQIGHHLPQLRRFSRLVSGSQTSGDAYVVAALESIVDGSHEIGPGSDVRLALYRLLLAIWDSVPLNFNDTVSRTGAVPGEGRLAALTPRARQAFLLRTVEGFSPREAASIMDVSEGDLERLMNMAHEEIAAEVATSILIIEDEPLIAMDLQSIVEELGHKVVAIARTHREAVAKASDAQPGLILADTQRADGRSGLDAVNQILTTFSVPVIFVTAYPERLLTGERPEPTFLINKPFRPEVIQAVVSQALFFNQQAQPRAS